MYVSKSWRDNLLKPDFLNLHLSIKEPATLFLCVKERTLYWLEFHGESCYFNFAASLSKKYEFLNSCNGLLYLREHKSGYSPHLVVYVLNPITREYMSLPPSDDGWGLDTKLGGLGFSPTINQFKAIRIYEPELHFEGLQVEVYTLGSGIWRSIGGIPLDLNDIFGFWDLQKAFVKGKFHWLIENYYDFRLSTFDFESEQFGSMPLPRLDVVESYIMTDFGVLRETIYFFYYNLHERPWFKEIWVMKQYGVVESWTKILVIEDQVELRNQFLFEVIKFFDNGDILLLCNGSLVLYDPETESYTRLDIQGNPSLLRAIVHKPRLASLKDDVRGGSSRVLNAGS